jgi:hypothetical protein
MTYAVGGCGSGRLDSIRTGGQTVADEVAFTGQSGRTWRYWVTRLHGKPGGFGGVYAAKAWITWPFLCNERRTTVLEFVDRIVELTKALTKSG